MKWLSNIVVSLLAGRELISKMWESIEEYITEYKWHNFYIFNILSQGDTEPYRIADFVKY